MVGKIYDYPTRYLVESESETGAAYMVDLADPEFVVLGKFNGSCQCPNFQLGAGKKPSLKKQIIESGYIQIHRCKHIRFAREELIDWSIENMAKVDPNIPERHQV